MRSLDAREAVGLALLGLAHVAWRARDEVWLRGLLEESATLLFETGSPGLPVWLSFMGRVRIDQGEHAHGVRLLAAGESDGPRFGSLRYLLYQLPRSAVDSSLATAQSALGEVAFKAAWGDGKALPTQHAVASVLSDGPPKPDPVKTDI